MVKLIEFDMATGHREVIAELPNDTETDLTNASAIKDRYAVQDTETDHCYYLSEV